VNGALAYTVAEAAQVLGVSRSHLYRVAKRGQGPPRLELGSRILFPKAALHRWLEENAATPARSAS